MYKPIILAFLSLIITLNSNAKEIAITFDDAPLSGSSLMSGSEKTEKIISGLKKANVNQALFFVTTKNIINEESLKRLQRYTDAGFNLANHSHSHQSSRKLSPNKYLADVYTSHLILNNFTGLLRLHRFPFLHQANSLEARTQIYQGLSELGYKLGYVTVDNYDWYLNSTLVNAQQNGLKVNLDTMKQLYLDSILEAIEFYDSIATKSLGRSPRHVLLLHENELAALFITDLIDHIRANGWKIISPQSAYQDPIASLYDPKLEFTNQGLVAALAHQKGAPKKELVHPNEDTDYLDRRIKQLKIFSQQ